MSRDDRRSAAPDDDETLEPLHSEDSGPASNGEQVLLAKPHGHGHGDAQPGQTADPAAAERAAAEAEERSVGRGG